MTINTNSYFLVNSIDPTRTLTIRTKFVASMKFRFAQLMAVIRHAIIELDVLALTERKIITNVAPVSNLSSRQFEFMSSDQKIEAFVQWMNEQSKQYILSGGRIGIRSIGDLLPEATEARNSWIKAYIDSAYQQGIKRARQELKKLGIDVDDEKYEGSDKDSIQTAFNNPMNADRVGLIYTRAYSSLKGITAEMDSVVSDVLALGIADGRGPREIARLLNKVITGDGTGDDLSILDSLGRKIPARRRAEVLARTEVIRAHHSANIAEYKAAGMMGIKILVEHLTAGDNRVCPQCAPLNGKLYKIEEAENIIPVHPQCRCVAIPYIDDKEKVKQTKDVSYLREEIPSSLKENILSLTKSDGKERLALIDGIGNISKISTGDTESVELPKNWLAKMLDINEKIHSIHTHPIEETLSVADIQSFSKFPGVKKVTAILPSGAEWSSNILSSDLDGLYRRANELFLEMKTSILDRLISGDINQDQAKKLMFSEQVKLLKKLKKENWISLSYQEG